MKAIKEDQEKLLVSAWYSLVNHRIYSSIFDVFKWECFVLFCRAVHSNVKNTKNVWKLIKINRLCPNNGIFHRNNLRMIRPKNKLNTHKTSLSILLSFS